MVNENDLIKQLRESEEKYRKMIELANDAIFAIDPESGKIVEANPKAEEMTGRDQQDLMGMSVWDLHPTEDRENAKTLFNNVVKSGKGYCKEMQFVKPDGSRLIVDIGAAHISFGGKLLIQRICRDVTAQRRLEQENRSLRKYYEHILNRMPVGLGVKTNVDTEPRVEFENSKLIEMFHSGGEDESHSHWHMVEDELLSRDRMSMNENGAVSIEREIPDGRIFQFTSSYYREDSGSWHELQVVQDITRRRRLEDDLQRANLDLEAKVEERTRELRDKQTQLVQSEKMAALGNLVAGIAHEINTPLGALKSNIDLFARSVKRLQDHCGDKSSDSKAFTELVERMAKLNVINESATERIVNIVTSLRSFARLDMAEMDRVDLHEGLDSTLTLVHHELKDRIEITKDYGSIPKVNCYPNQLNQVFMNLLVNAAHAIEGKGNITVRTYTNENQVMVEIIDTGRGIPKENIRRIFDPGFTTKGFGVGTGLGLSIVHQIMESHRGTIEVESEVGAGTTFRLRLPLG